MIEPFGRYRGPADESALEDVEWTRLITAEEIETFDRDGVLLLKQALHPEWIDLVELAYQRVMLSPHSMARFFRDQPGEFLESVHNLPHVPELRQLLIESPIADMIGALIESTGVWYFLDEFFIKEGGNCGPTPWHQDLPYWPVAGKQFASMWINLDPVPQSECLQFVRGSHRGQVYDGFHPAKVNDDMRAPYYDAELPQVPDIDAEPDRWDIVSWPIERGDVVFLHPGVLHGGGHTGPDSQRRTWTVRCYGDDVVYASRPNPALTVPRRPGLGFSLKPGDPLRHLTFPQLRPGKPELVW